MSEHTEPIDTTPDEEPAKKPWWKRWWGITLIVIVGLFVLGGIVGEDTDDDLALDETEEVDEPASEPEEEAPADPEPDSQPDPEPDEEAEPEPEPEPEPGFGDGTHVVGDDVDPATYRSTGDRICYWARLSGFSGELDDIITNGNNSPEIVTISADDAGFETQGCGRWLPVEDTAPDTPATEFGDGTYQVGVHIEPGTYRADGDEMCYWARLSDFSQELDGVITNGNNPTTIEIAAGDAGFTTFGCGTWTMSG